MGGAALWIFGYGSLLWRPAFQEVERRPAWLSGWSRRFWQGSVDHRGVPGAPGRVVTLVPEPGSRCFGMAFRVPDGSRSRILAALDHRESGGYERVEVSLELAVDRAPPQPAPVATAGLVYVAAPGNPNYLGPAPLDEMARQVRDAHGPSGPNPEYVLRLDAALREHRAPDPHVAALAQRLRELRERERG